MTAASCRTLGCGSLDSYLDMTVQARADWIQVRTTSVVPPRWYCSRACASADLLTEAAPLVLSWDGTVDLPGPGSPRTGGVRVGATAAGTPAVLVLDDAQRMVLASLIGAEVRDITRTCPTLACGVDADDLDASDPALRGWIAAQVAGSETPLRWYCGPLCVHDALARAGAELADADLAAGYDPVGGEVR